ncbi:MAG: dTMP kinase, partial [Cyanobacteria bacterium REEB65]|nr:dTMP kinase [Cyanobacteria bacterium REEB65]
AGKSTQIALLAQALENRGLAVLCTREPGGTAIGKRIRELLLDPAAQLVPKAELLLYAADRAQHVEQVLRPALAAGQVVLCDRHADSLVAYQAFGRGLDRQVIANLNGIATGGLRPDRTVVLDVAPEIGLARAGRRSNHDRLERESLEFHQRVREGFLAIARAEPERVRIVPAGGSPQNVHAAILREVCDLFENELPPEAR